MLALIASIALRSDVMMTPLVEFDYRNRAGLTASFNGVPLIRGSLIQIIDPTTSRTQFSSTSNDQQVEKHANGDLFAKFTSPNGLASGTQTYSKTETGFKIVYSLKWTGLTPVKAEWSLGQIWARPFLGGAIKVGNEWRGLPISSKQEGTAMERKLGTTAREIELQSPVGKLSVKGSSPDWTLFDARGFEQPWANGNELLWLGQMDVSLQPNLPVTAELEVSFSPNNFETVTRGLAPEGERLAEAVVPDNTEWPLIPKPKQALFNRETAFTIPDQLQVDAGDAYYPITQELIESIQLHWDAPFLTANQNYKGNVMMRVQNLALGPEGYEIKITPEAVILMGQDETGLRHAVRTLGFLAFVKNGKLSLPCGSLRDWPSIAWRGVHLFGGPEIRAFHTKLANRVLAPLKINRALIQCERTRWSSFPKIATAQFNSKEDLKATFDMYRRLGIEPIPLIQSLGHMSWFFENKQNLNLAVNPDYPFTIDPRKPGTQEALEKLWEEAAELLKPKVMHFGMDEFDIRGMPDDPALSTQIWEKSWPILNSIAVKHGATPMLWGDKGLAPGQAIDAALGDNSFEAMRRRQAIPKNAIVADWHYRNYPRGDKYMLSIGLFRSLGLTTVGSGWFNGDNIKGFCDACYQSGSGYLQTTWAGYQSDEAAVLREFKQFAAYVHAADYAWSNRSERYTDLPYDAGQVFSRLFFGQPSPITISAGTTLPGIRSHAIGDVNFRVGSPIALISILSSNTSREAAEITITPKGLNGRVVAFAVDTSIQCQDRDPVAEITVFDEKGKSNSRRLLYGSDLRASGDPRATVSMRNGSLSLIKIPLPIRGTVSKIVLKATSTYAGMRVHGITAY
ncbi:MAG: glycoside hydrolase family 20 zincin-like fold domain-containing protein [Fimbriimonadaceae bacterium]